MFGILNLRTDSCRTRLHTRALWTPLLSESTLKDDSGREKKRKKKTRRVGDSNPRPYHALAFQSDALWSRPDSASAKDESTPTADACH